MPFLLLTVTRKAILYIDLGSRLHRGALQCVKKTKIFRGCAPGPLLQLVCTTPQMERLALLT